jgi:hypothetical protein
MNRKLKHELLKIVRIDPDQQKIARVEWEQRYNHREKFLDALRKKQEKDFPVAELGNHVVFSLRERTKQRKRFYSASVINYDRKYGNG